MRFCDSQVWSRKATLAYTSNRVSTNEYSMMQFYIPRKLGRSHPCGIPLVPTGTAATRQRSNAAQHQDGHKTVGALRASNFRYLSRDNHPQYLARHFCTAVDHRSPGPKVTEDAFSTREMHRAPSDTLHIYSTFGLRNL